MNIAHHKLAYLILEEMKPDVLFLAEHGLTSEQLPVLEITLWRLVGHTLRGAHSYRGLTPGNV